MKKSNIINQIIGIGFCLVILLLALSSFNKESLSLSSLLDKDFKHIAKFDNSYSDSEIKKLEKDLLSIGIVTSIEIERDKEGKIYSAIINLKNAMCESKNFESGIIMINNSNDCSCAISGRKI